MRILVADDDEFFREMAEDILTEAGHEVIPAADGAETLQKAVAEKPDVIVLDIILPGLLGTEVSEKLREHSRTSMIPILLVSSRFGELEDDEELLEYFQADDFLKKPFLPEELLERVNQLGFTRSNEPKDPGE